MKLWHASQKMSEHVKRNFIYDHLFIVVNFEQMFSTFHCIVTLDLFIMPQLVTTTVHFYCFLAYNFQTSLHCS